MTLVAFHLAGFDVASAVLLIPLLSGLVLALLPGYRLTSRINVAAAGATFLCALLLLIERPAASHYLFVDDLNIVFIILSTFVGFTTSAFSASYIGHEIENGKLKPAYVRFYHAMYQALMFAMNLGLLANNIGLMWVAIELATLTTVVMVGIYRTPAGARGGVEIFHPRQRRHRARPLRHHPRLYVGAAFFGRGL